MATKGSQNRMRAVQMTTKSSATSRHGAYVMLDSKESHMKNRSRIEIMSQILDVANGGGATKTKIMYKAFLSYAQLKEYLTILIEKGLIGHDKENAVFNITQKGIKFIGIYAQMAKLSGAMTTKVPLLD
jgi:predicted transcriptional regulator